MKETVKTIVFVCTSLAMTGLALVTYWTSLPRGISDFGSIGLAFFDDFESASQATSLEVLALDEKGKRRRFEVRKTGNVWTIPSHYNYPAEAADRLTNTASSVIGLKREALAGRNATEHERFGVLDPNAEGAADPEATGKRLTLKDSKGDLLADFIIGKQAEMPENDADRAAFKQDRTVKYFYVRRADENQTYKVKLDISLSTKFADWIDPDLLQIEANNLMEMSIDNYKLEEQAADPLGRVKTLAKVGEEPSFLTRKTGFDPWTLEGFDPAAGNLDTVKINDIASAVTGLKIVGVRPKFQYNNKQIMTADLEVNVPPEIKTDPRQMEAFQEALFQLQDDLASRGFNLTRVEDKIALVSEFGEFMAATSDGIAFNLQFGKEVEGDESFIEIGDQGKVQGATTGQPSEKAEVESTESSKVTAASTSDPAVANKSESTNSKNRYAMIRVKPTIKMLGEIPSPPSEPTEPVKPEGYIAKPTPPVPDPAKGETAVQEVADTRDAAFIEYDQRMLVYQQEKTTFEMDKSKYEMDLKNYQEKLKAAHDRVAELNDRFGNWYYVVSSENLASLLVKQADLIKAPPPETQLPPRPNIGFEQEVPAPDEGSGGTETPPPTDLIPEKSDDGSGGGSDKGGS